MSGDPIKPGDRVIYIDVDEITWGPWQVVKVEAGSITVKIDPNVEYGIESGFVRKIDLN